MRLRNLALALSGALLLAACGTAADDSSASSGNTPASDSTTSSSETSSSSATSASSEVHVSSEAPASSEETTSSEAPASSATSEEPAIEWVAITEEEFAAWATEKKKAQFADVTSYSLTGTEHGTITKGETVILDAETMMIIKLDLNPDDAYLGYAVTNGEEGQYMEIVKDDTTGGYVSTMIAEGKTMSGTGTYDDVKEMGISMLGSMCAYSMYSSDVEGAEGFYKSADGSAYRLDAADETNTQTFDDGGVTVTATLSFTDGYYVFDQTGLMVDNGVVSTATFDKEGYTYNYDMTYDIEVNGVVDHTSIIPAA